MLDPDYEDIIEDPVDPEPEPEPEPEPNPEAGPTPDPEPTPDNPFGTHAAGKDVSFTGCTGCSNGCLHTCQGGCFTSCAGSPKQVF